METILPWYIAGPLLGLMIPVILVLNEKQLGVSSSLRVTGSFLAPQLNYFKYDRRSDLWQVWFATGIIIVSVVLHQFGYLNLQQTDEQIYQFSNWPAFLIGGIAVGFGARYAGGCTAGHCIMGNSLLATSSIVSTVSFFAGGLIITHLIIPLIF